MKIYNEIISRFNETTQQWEDVYEDSFDHDGGVMLMMPEECGIVGDIDGDGVYDDEAAKLQALLAGDQHGGCSHIQSQHPDTGEWYSYQASQDCSYVWGFLNFSHNKRVVCENDTSFVVSVWDNGAVSFPYGTGVTGHQLCGLPLFGTLQFALLDISGDGTINSFDWVQLLQYESGADTYVLESGTAYVSPCVGISVGDECCMTEDLGTSSLEVASEESITLSGITSYDVDFDSDGNIVDCLLTGNTSNCLYYKWTLFDVDPPQMSSIVSSLLSNYYSACEACENGDWKLCDSYPCILGETVYGTNQLDITTAPFVPYGGDDPIAGGYSVDLFFGLEVEDPEGASSTDAIPVTVIGSVNHSPTITFGNTVFDEQISPMYDIPFVLSDTDNNYGNGLPSLNQPLTISNIAAASGDISWVGQAGNNIRVSFVERVLVDTGETKTYTITYDYSDGLETISDSVVLTIQDANEPPTASVTITNQDGDETTTFTENESMTVIMEVTDIDSTDWPLYISGMAQHDLFANFSYVDGTLSGDTWTHSFTTTLPHVASETTYYTIYYWNDQFHAAAALQYDITVAPTVAPTMSHTITRNGASFNASSDRAMPGDTITMTITPTLNVNTTFAEGFPKWERNTITMNVPGENEQSTGVVNVNVDTNDGLDLPANGSLEYTFTIPPNDTRAQCFVNQPIDILISLKDNYDSTNSYLVNINTKCPPLPGAPDKWNIEGTINCGQNSDCDNYLTSTCCYGTALFTVMHDDSYSNCDNIIDSVTVTSSGNTHVTQVEPYGLLQSQTNDGTVDYICYGQVNFTYDAQHSSLNGGSTTVSVSATDTVTDLSTTKEFVFGVSSAVDQPVARISSTVGTSGTVINDSEIPLNELISYTVYADTSYSYDCSIFFDEELDIPVDSIYTMQNDGCLAPYIWYWTNQDGTLVTDDIPPETGPSLFAPGDSSLDEWLSIGTYTFTAPIITGTSPVYRVLNLIVSDYHYQYHGSPTPTDVNYPSIQEIVTALGSDVWNSWGVPHSLAQTTFQFNPVAAPAWSNCTDNTSKQYPEASVSLGAGCSTTGGTGGNVFSWVQTKGMPVVEDISSNSIQQSVTVPHIPSDLNCIEGTVQYSDDGTNWTNSGQTCTDATGWAAVYYRTSCLRPDGQESDPVVFMSNNELLYNSGDSGFGIPDVACWETLGVNDTPPTPLEFQLTVIDSSTSSNTRTESFDVYTEIILTELEQFSDSWNTVDSDHYGTWIASTGPHGQPALERTAIGTVSWQGISTDLIDVFAPGDYTLSFWYKQIPSGTYINMRQCSASDHIYGGSYNYSATTGCCTNWQGHQPLIGGGHVGFSSNNNTGDTFVANDDTWREYKTTFSVLPIDSPANFTDNIIDCTAPCGTDTSLNSSGWYNCTPSECEFAGGTIPNSYSYYCPSPVTINDHRVSIRLYDGSSASIGAIITHPMVTQHETQTIHMYEDDGPTDIYLNWDDYMSDSGRRAVAQNIIRPNDGWKVIDSDHPNGYSEGAVLGNSSGEFEDMDMAYPHTTLPGASIIIDENWHNNGNAETDSFEIKLYNDISGGGDLRVIKIIKYIIRVEAVNDPPVAIITTG